MTAWEPEHCRLDVDDVGIARIVLDRPEVKNAFSGQTIRELVGILDRLEALDGVRALVMCSSGDIFSSGVDVGWLSTATPEDVDADLRELSRFLRRYHALDLPTVALVGGPAFGGALGIISASDVVIGTSRSEFAFREVRLGLVPSIISPYVISRIGPVAAKRLFLTAEVVHAAASHALGLIDILSHDGAGADEALARVCEDIISGEPGAQAAVKKLVGALAADRAGDSAAEELIERAKKTRSSDAAQRRMSSFLKKIR